ncbi:MAG: DUF4143 domain-containing protein, partial [Phycisphaerae bacterium]|nr:DUF4143 domain-containing protein [Phycisphaerae bacterium]
YLDILTETFMIRQLQPWRENIAKRQVKSPKIYFCDTGLLHSLLDINDSLGLYGHPQVGASWEGFAMEQILRIVRPAQAYFWATYAHAELDLFFIRNGKRYGLEFKMNEAPSKTKSMDMALESLKLDKLLIVYPGETSWPVNEKITVSSLGDVEECLTK